MQQISSCCRSSLRKGISSKRWIHRYGKCVLNRGETRTRDRKKKKEKKKGKSTTTVLKLVETDTMTHHENHEP